MYHFFLGTRVTAFPTKLFGVHLNHFLPCFSETTVSLYPVTLALPSVVALLGLPLGALAVKLTGTGATSLVDGCVSQGGAVLSPPCSDSDGEAGGEMAAVPGGYIAEVFGGANKALPGDSSAITHVRA